MNNFACLEQLISHIPCAGTKFFPGYLNDRRRVALDNASLAWQDLGRQTMKMLERKGVAEDQEVMLPQRATGGSQFLLAMIYQKMFDCMFIVADCSGDVDAAGQSCCPVVHLALAYLMQARRFAVYWFLVYCMSHSNACVCTFCCSDCSDRLQRRQCH